jgi:adenylate kinase
MRILIVGPQGAGKGTQATLLAENLKIPHISTGDIFRANVTAGTELGVLAKKYMDSGDLVPDEVTSAMVKARLEESDADGGFLLDGFPRTVPQAQWLAGVLHENNHDLDAVLLLEAPDDVLMDRMLARGRADDTAEAISRRLALYHSETTPLLEHYAKVLVAIDGVGTVEEVQRRALDALQGQVDDGGTDSGDANQSTTG